MDYATWRDFIAPKLDMARMVDDRTGLPFTSERLELALKDVFETIRTEGWSKKNPSGAGASSAGGGKALANRRLDHRFLVFKDADTWMAYNERFGETDPFSAMVSHIDGMARDIAMMEVLGPNPSAMLRWMEERIGRDRSRGAYAFRRMWDAGSVVSFGSDSPGTNASRYYLNPLLGIYAAVTRKTLSGAPEGGWFPQEKLTVEQAMTGHVMLCWQMNGADVAATSPSP